MANKLKKLPNFLNKSPWLWRSCTQSRTLSFRRPNDIFRTINSAYDDDEEEETQRAEMWNNDDDNEDQIEALVRRVRVRQGKRLFLELDETNSIMTTATVAVTVAGNFQVPFKESVAMAMESKDPYLDFKKSMEEMVEAHGLKDWKGMELLLSWYLKANGKPNHEFIIGAFVDLLVDLAFASSFTNNSPSPSSSSTTSSLLCSSCSSTFPNSSSCSSCSSFRAPNSTILSNSLEIMEHIVESECSSSSSSLTRVTPPYLSSLYEDEEVGTEEDF